LKQFLLKLHSGAALQLGGNGNKGSEGIFYVVNSRGNVWGGGNQLL
jgi:hypothetical protein